MLVYDIQVTIKTCEPIGFFFYFTGANAQAKNPNITVISV